MKSLSIVLAATLVVSVTLSSHGVAQRAAGPAPGAAPPGEVVVGSGNYSPIVNDLDKTIEFYGNLLGLTVPPAPAPGPRPFSTDPAIRNMFGVPSAQLRWVVAGAAAAAAGPLLLIPLGVLGLVPPDTFALAHKQRQHEHVGREPRFADQRAHRCRLPEPP